MSSNPPYHELTKSSPKSHPHNNNINNTLTTKNPLLSLLLQPIQWLKMLSTTLSPSFILGVVLVYGLDHGFSGSYFRVVSDFYWKDVQKINPSHAQFYVGLYFIPWIMRPIWGLLTDVLPIMGYHRRPYFIIAGLIGVFSTIVLTMDVNIPASLALLCMIGASAAMAIGIVCIDACIAKNSIEVKELAADLQSLGGFCASVGSLIGFSCSGVLVHRLGAQGAFGFLAIPPASILVLGFFIHDVKISNAPHSSGSHEKEVIQRTRSALKNMYKTMKFPQVWKPSLFMYLAYTLSYSTHEGHFYWYTDSKEGPGFSKEFVGMIYAIGAVGSIIGVMIYHKYLKDFPFRNIIFSIQFLYAISGMLDLLFILRWNLALGIPDSFFIIMEETILHIISRIRWMPMLVLSTKLCPLGIEGTFFALLMCIDNIGSLSSKMIGGLVLHLLHVSRTNFTNLWLAVFIRNCLRFVTLALVFLIPDATQYDVLVPSSDNNLVKKEEVVADLELVPLNEKVEFFI